MRKLRNESTGTAAASVAAATLLLAGCVSTDMSDLDQYVSEVLARPPRTAVEPLPEIKVPETYAYQSAEAGKPDPFESFLKRRAAEKGPEGGPDDPATLALRREIEGRNPEELEQFELDGLRMVGTIEDNNELWGVILDKEGTVHRVKVGNYMGKNYGKVMSISEDKIELREIFSTSDGGLEERPAAVALSEQE
ncbi:MAG: pilus assembly protein PilP [Chromatiales bacterium]